MNKSLKLALVAGTVLFAVPSHGMFRRGVNLFSRITTLKKATDTATARRFFSSKQPTLYKNDKNNQLIPYNNKKTNIAKDIATLKKIEKLVFEYRHNDYSKLTGRGQLADQLAYSDAARHYLLNLITNDTYALRYYWETQKLNLNLKLYNDGIADDIYGYIPENIKRLALSHIKKDEVREISFSPQGDFIWNFKYNHPSKQSPPDNNRSQN